MRTVRYEPETGLYRMSGQKPVGEPVRCPTCGRASDCCCGEDCPFCVDGVPTPDRRLARGLHLLQELAEKVGAAEMLPAIGDDSTPQQADSRQP